MKDREFWLALRQALLFMVDAIERRFEFSPLTAQLRKRYKSSNVVK